MSPSLLSCHGDISQRTELAGKDEKLRKTELQAGKIQAANMNRHFPAVSHTVTDISRMGFWVSTSEDGS